MLQFVCSLYFLMLLNVHILLIYSVPEIYGQPSFKSQEFSQNMHVPTTRWSIHVGYMYHNVTL